MYKSNREEDIYESELMTGYIPDDGVAPMSLLTVRSLADLGYTVNISNAENFTVRKEIVDDLDWDDAREGKPQKKRLRVDKSAAKERKKRKESYGDDVLKIKRIVLDGKKKVR